MACITLTTDFGTKDGAPAMMKGVIWKIAPQVNIADISHHIQPQNVLEAAMLLTHSFSFFPDNTVHVIVVDPGVGTTRRPIAAKINSHFFVCPDNGILTLILESAEANGWYTEVVNLDNKAFWRDEVSDIFHGRDIFAPIAAHLSLGIPLSKLGTPVCHDLVRFHFPLPERTDSGWKGEIIYIDSFGNILTNFFEQIIGKPEVLTLRLADVNINKFVRTFGLGNPQELIVLFSTASNLMISVRDGNAAEKLNAKIGDAVELFIS